MDLDQAGQAHSDWKIKLRMAIAKKEALDAAAITAENQCAFGQWLLGEAKGKYGKLPAYADCVSKHAAFHHEAGKVAQTINSGNYGQAKTMMDANTPYALAANGFIIALGTLKKEAGL
jgi:methyl-accepting chemotaxis protein